MKYFGTDGFRGEANVTLNVEHAYKVGRFLGNYFQKEEVVKMKNVLKKYSGVLFLYLVIVGMVLLINARFNYLNSQNQGTNYSLKD